MTHRRIAKPGVPSLDTAGETPQKPVGAVYGEAQIVPEMALFQIQGEHLDLARLDHDRANPALVSVVFQLNRQGVRAAVRDVKFKVAAGKIRATEASSVSIILAPPVTAAA